MSLVIAFRKAIAARGDQAFSHLSEPEALELLIAVALESTVHELNKGERIQRARDRKKLNDDSREYLKQRRRRRGVTRGLLGSDPFANVVRSVLLLSKAEPSAQVDYFAYLAMWLVGAMRTVVLESLGPVAELKAKLANAKQERAEIKKLVEGIASRGPEYANVAEKLAQTFWEEKSYDDAFLTSYMLDLDLLGRTGSAATNPEGAKRGWLVMELDRRLPDYIENRNQTIADLLRSIGLGEPLDSGNVGSIIASRKRQKKHIKLISALDDKKRLSTPAE